MKFNKKYDIDNEFASLFEFNSERDELKHDAYILMFKFLSEIERTTENTLYKKDLAKALDTSKSFISQLFSGNKLANFLTMSKLQKAYDITFQVRAVHNNARVLTHIGVDPEYEHPKTGLSKQYENNPLTFVHGGGNYSASQAG